MSGKIWVTETICAPDGANCFYVDSGNVLQDHLITEMPFALFVFVCVGVCVCLSGWVGGWVHALTVISGCA